MGGDNPRFTVDGCLPIYESKDKATRRVKGELTTEWHSQSEELSSLFG